MKTCMLLVLLLAIGPSAAGSAPASWTPITHTINGVPVVYVPAGCFVMGSETSLYGNQRPAHEVCLSSFWIGQTEVTNAQYAACVEAGVCDPPHRDPMWFDAPEFHYDDPAYGEYPVVFVSWENANQFAVWVEGSLPTEAQWEYAARGPEGFTYPWGETFDGTLANHCDTGCPFTYQETDLVDDGYPLTAPGGSYPGGASWVGALDMAGNLWEWIADWYAEDAYAAVAGGTLDPTGPPTPDNRHRHVVRSASWGDPTLWMQTTHRDGAGPTSRNFVYGFRVVMVIPRE